jgi:hypothetical protein
MGWDVNPGLRSDAKTRGTTRRATPAGRRSTNNTAEMLNTSTSDVRSADIAFKTPAMPEPARELEDPSRSEALRYNGTLTGVAELPRQKMNVEDFSSLE